MPERLPRFTTEDLHFDVIGIEEMRIQVSTLESEFARMLARCINSSLIAIDRNAKRAAPTGLAGQLRAGIHATFATPENLTGTVGSYARHAAFMEFGTSRLGASTNTQPLPPWYRHGSTHKLPPADALKPWCRVKLKDEGAAYGLSLWIAGKVKRWGWGWSSMASKLPGLKARPYFYPAARSEMPLFADRVVRESQKLIEGAGK